jgi:hypothetical protein
MKIRVQKRIHVAYQKKETKLNGFSLSASEIVYEGFGWTATKRLKLKDHFFAKSQPSQSEKLPTYRDPGIGASRMVSAI